MAPRPGWLLGLPLVLALGAGKVPAQPEICKYCPGPAHDTSEVYHYCKQRQELNLTARCCLNKQGTIVGLDLQNCSLKELDPLFAEAHSAIVLDLRANPLLNIPTSAFRNFTELQTLVVPLKLSCPGGNVSWDNITFDGDSYICQGQRSLCNGTVQPAALCPENAYCVPDGPGLFQCLCTSDFHGYKCLREGSFPLLMFSGILGTTTFCISILLWGTQLRKIKAS
ncbi:all-trans retinoic acid-induced differentiation factor isoform X2 [Macrotis lagotis]|uniref:all-trans retinoic acid-induced differentiation factor isoform X2 n=1 Tax=Macrotis lagotis TaxID=92651 RepID=UPI003D68FACA